MVAEQPYMVLTVSVSRLEQRQLMGQEDLLSLLRRRGLLLGQLTGTIEVWHDMDSERVCYRQVIPCEVIHG